MRPTGLFFLRRSFRSIVFAPGNFLVALAGDIFLRSDICQSAVKLRGWQIGRVFEGNVPPFFCTLEGETFELVCGSRRAFAL